MVVAPCANGIAEAKPAGVLKVVPCHGWPVALLSVFNTMLFAFIGSAANIELVPSKSVTV